MAGETGEVRSAAGGMAARLARALAVPSRAELLSRLREATSPLTAAELATATGLHVNTVRSHLEQLVEVELVTKAVTAANRPGRPAAGYQAADETAGSQAAGYQELAAALVREMSAGVDPRGAATRAGRRWASDLEPADATGGAVDPIRRLVAVLRRLGFQPSTEPLGDRIYLHACPIAALAREHPEVVCAMHRGLVGELLDRAGAPMVVKGVDRLVRDNLCLVRLVPRFMPA